MAPDEFTEITSTSIFGRLGQSIKGVLVGIIFVIAAFPVMFWNEGRAVKTQKSLEGGAKTVISVPSDKVDSGNEGKLVHMTGMASTEDTLSDPDFGISANAIKLVRVAEMYQWKEDSTSETKKKLGGGTETVKKYKYKKVWDDSYISSENFKVSEGHQNPGQMKVKGETLTAENVKLGAFKLSPELVTMISKSEPLSVSDDALENVKNKEEGMKVSGGLFYIGDDPQSPEIGDVKVSFKVVKPGTVSIVAKQTGETFEAMKTDYKDLLFLQMGTVSADNMFKAEIEKNKMWTWILRLVGFFLLMIGITTIFKPLTVMGDVIPFVGDMLGFGIGLFAGVIAFALSLLTISIAWVFYRPLIGIPLLVVAVGSIVALKVLVKKKPAA